MASAHKLPKRRRVLTEAVDTSQTPGPTGGGVAEEKTEESTLDVTAFTELVRSSVLRRRLLSVLMAAYQPSVVDRRHVVPEIEINAVLLTLPVKKDPVPSSRQTGMLLRAFRKQTTTSVAQITHTERIEDWASAKIAHLARAIEGLEMTLVFGMMVSQVTDHQLEDGRHVSHRSHTYLRGAARHPHDMKLKERVRVPLLGTDASYLQLSLEWPVGDTPDPVTHAMRKGFFVPATNTRTSYFAKLSWTGRHPNLPFEVSFRLVFNVETARRLEDARKPRSPADVNAWLVEVGAIGTANWDVEVETHQPTDMESIGKALYFFYLLRRNYDGSVPRNSLRAMVLRDCQVDPRGVEINHARLILEHICTLGGLYCPEYPHQPRPHDFTVRDLHRLSQTLVTPKVDGREGFLVCHAAGAVILHRNGDALPTRWRSGGGLVPLILSVDPPRSRNEGTQRSRGGGRW